MRELINHKLFQNQKFILRTTAAYTAFMFALIICPDEEK